MPIEFYYTYSLHFQPVPPTNDSCQGNPPHWPRACQLDDSNPMTLVSHPRKGAWENRQIGSMKRLTEVRHWHHVKATLMRDSRK